MFDPVPKGFADDLEVTQYTARVLLCSLIVHALHDSLHRERAYVGASQQRLFWFSQEYLKNLVCS